MASNQDRGGGGVGHANKSTAISNVEFGLENFQIVRCQARGGRGAHSSAANEDSCGYSVKQIGTPICVPAINSCDMFKPLLTPFFDGRCCLTRNEWSHTLHVPTRTKTNPGLRPMLNQ